MVDRKYSHTAGMAKVKDFNVWLGSLKQFKQKVVIAGNHDAIFEEIGCDAVGSLLSNAKYIENAVFNECGVKFFATPFSESEKYGGEKGSLNRAFQSQEFAHRVQGALEEHKQSGIDVLVSHGRCSDIEAQLRPKIHLWGHAHSQWGIKNSPNGISVCAAMMSERYELSRLPIVIDISIPIQKTALQSSDILADTHSMANQKYNGCTSLLFSTMKTAARSKRETKVYAASDS
jgi:hypothetical protein